MHVQWVFVSPVVFFEEWIKGNVRWSSVLSVVFVWCTAQTATSVLVASRLNARTIPDVPASSMVLLNVLGGVAIFGGLIFSFMLMACGLAIFDVLFKQSGESRRLVACTGLSYIVQIPWAFLSFCILAWIWEPSELSVPILTTESEAQEIIQGYRARQLAGPIPSTIALIGMLFGLWSVAVQACALRVVSGFSAAGASVAGVIIGVVLVVLPWAIRRF